MMTVRQVDKALKKNKYILLRTLAGNQYAFNCGIRKILKKKNRQSIYSSYKPCGIHEYISKKLPFIDIKKYERI